MTETKKKHEQIVALLDLEECEQAAYKVFCEIMRRHGKTEARRIFLKFGRPPSNRKIGKIKNYALLDRHDMMKPGPNVKASSGESGHTRPKSARIDTMMRPLQTASMLRKRTATRAAPGTKRHHRQRAPG
jgi:hypothetical protein